MHTLRLGETFVEPGVLAWDDVDGNITSDVAAWGLGAVDTRRVTTEGSPFVITYNAADHAGNQAKQVRPLSSLCPQGLSPLSLPNAGEH